VKIIPNFYLILVLILNVILVEEFKGNEHYNFIFSLFNTVFWFFGFIFFEREYLRKNIFYSVFISLIAGFATGYILT